MPTHALRAGAGAGGEVCGWVGGKVRGAGRQTDRQTAVFHDKVKRVV